MKKTITLFKNDPFGIKWKIYCIKLKWLIKKGIKVQAKCIEVYLQAIHAIGIPKNDEETELLKQVINKYDEVIREIEQSLKYTRMYIKE